MRDEERWADTPKLCNGFASHDGPCGDPHCSDCYPGGRECRECGMLDGECECDNCEDCGCAWMTEFSGQGYEVCPYCHCEDCGENEKECKCEGGFDNGNPETNEEIRKKKE